MKAKLHELVAALAAAKAEEEQARQRRLQIEEEILALMPSKDEGTVTDKDAGITVTYKLTRTVDTEALQARWLELSAAAQAAFRWKAEVDLRALRTLDEADYKLAAAYITTKPAKPTVTIRS